MWGGRAIQLVSCRKGKRHQSSVMLCLTLLTHRAKAMQAHCKKVAIDKPGRMASSQTNQANDLILDFKPPEL